MNIYPNDKVISSANTLSNSGNTQSSIANNSLISKATRIISIVTITLLSLSTIGITYNTNAKAIDKNLSTNPEAILSVQVKDNIYLDNIIDNELPKDRATQDRYIVTSLSGLTTVGNQDQLITISGEYKRSTVKREYKKAVSSYLAKLDAIKQAGTDNLVVANNNGTNTTQPLDQESKTLLNNQLKDISKSDISKARWDYLWGDAKVLTVTINGYLDTVTKIRDILNKTGHVKSLELIDTAQLAKDLEVTKKKIDQAKKNNPKAKELDLINQVVQESIQSKLTPEQIKQQAQASTLTEDKYKLVDSILSTDKNNNKTYKPQDFDKLPLTSQEKSIIKSMLQEYNNTPNYLKTNIQTTTNQIQITTTPTIPEKIEGVIEGLTKGVRAEAGAGGCTSVLKQYWHWWGVRNYLNNCAVNNLKGMINNTTAINTFLMMRGCLNVCGIVSLAIQWYGGQIEWANNNCGGEGVNIDTGWAQWPWERINNIKSIC
jgi:hypothetical protein